MFKLFKKQNQSKKINSTAGFTLVEMLVAIAVFMSVMTVAVTALLTIINANRETQAIKTTTDDVTFAIENISKDMRIGTDYECMQSDDTNFSNICKDSDGYTPGNTSVRYKNYSGKIIEYKFHKDTGQSDAGRLERREINTDDGTYTSQDLISTDSDVKISNMIFYVIGADCEDGGVSCSAKTQPRVIITISGVISSKGTANINFDLQTTISQSLRNG